MGWVERVEKVQEAPCMSEEIKALQRQLKNEKLYNGQIDGDLGPLTLAALMQREKTPLYLRVAAGELGVAEIYGSRDNPRIIAYHATTTLKATNDEVAWCSSFVNWSMLHGGYRCTNSAAAISWANWGVASKGKFGDAVIFKRKGGHHVAFWIYATKNKLWVLGGNQGNKVCIEEKTKDDVIAYRSAV